MCSDLNIVFREIQELIKIDALQFKNGWVDSTGLIGSLTPKVVPKFEQICSSVDLNPLIRLPWFPWLLAICRRLTEGVQGLEELASLSHITVTRLAVTKLVESFVMPCLPYNLPYPSAKHQLLESTTSPLTEQQKFSCVDLIVRVLLLLLDNAHTRGAVLKHYGELLAALLFLNSADSRDSNTGNLHHSSEASNTIPVPSGGCRDPAELLESGALQPSNSLKQRNLYKETITSLLDQVNQSTVFTHLMILNSTKGDGGKISRIVRKILDTKLQREGGVAALLDATIFPDRNASPQLTSPVSTQDILRICNLLTSKRSRTFLEVIVPQVLKLLKTKDKRVHQICANFIAQLEEKDATLCEELVMAPLLSSLEYPSAEGQIEETVEFIRTLVDASPPGGIPLARPLPLLCLLYCSISHSAAPIKAKLKDVLLACFKVLPSPCPFVLSLIIPSDPGVTYSLTPSSVITVKTKQPLDLEFISKTMLEFINENNLNKIKFDIYRGLLESVMNEKTHLGTRLISTKLLTELSADQYILDSLSRHPQFLINFLAELFTVENSSSEALCFGLIMLKVFLKDERVYSKPNLSIFSKLEAPLKHLSESTAYEIKTLTDEILSRLNYLNVIKTDDLKLFQQEKQTEGEGFSKCEDQGRLMESDYEVAYRQAMDALLPVRAHALRTLAKLLHGGDKPTLNNRTTLLHLFKMNLDSEDSYLYLSAVEGLSCLASTFPDEVVTVICHEFALREGKPDFRLKMGQVITKTICALGENCIKFKKELIETLLTGVRDPDPLVRASSLSNIGEISKVLSFRIHDYISQVLTCVNSVLDCEEELEVRRAAVLVISLLLEGLGAQTVQVLEDVLPSIYMKLKSLYKEDPDEVIRLHAQIALEHLSANLRTLLFSTPQLSELICNMDAIKL